MRSWVAGLVIAVLAGLLSTLAPGRACACSCAYDPDGPQIAELVAHAAAAFTGTVTAVRTEGATDYYEFAVGEVFTGDVGETTTLATATDAAACGTGFREGAEYLVLASRGAHGAPWSVNLCSGSTESGNQRTRDAMVTAFGNPRPPDPGVRSVEAGDIRPYPWRDGLIAVAVAATSIAIAVTVARRRRY